jgi:hypothetical protein
MDLGLVIYPGAWNKEMVYFAVVLSLDVSVEGGVAAIEFSAGANVVFFAFVLKIILKHLVVRLLVVVELLAGGIHRWKWAIDLNSGD